MRFRFTSSRVRFLSTVAAVMAVFVLAGCRQTHPGLAIAQPGGSLRQYDGQLEKDDGQWLRATKDYANTRFSALDQINQSNVAQLRPAFTFSTGVDRGQEAAPIVANGIMYIATPWPNVLYALDRRSAEVEV